MAAQEQVAVQPEKEMCAFGNDQKPKVRKPYTISKHREKWTDEEHRRFLEALKLYGRGWRQIEEHIGTKTAVQIRSHAQKFFSKVVRESSNSAESPIKPLEIPPPRPKRKPMHPYPRKSVDSLRGSSTPNQPERSPPPNITVNNGSPTSVLSAVASEMFESVYSEQHNGCCSPNSCTTDVQSVNLLPIEKENDNGSPSPPYVEEGKVSSPAVQLCSGSTMEIFLPKDASLKESGCTTGNETVPLSSIKLFGKTVSVTDPQKQSVEDHKSTISRGNSDVENAKIIVQIESDRQLSLGMFASDCDQMRSLEIVGNAPFPPWAAYQFFYSMPCTGSNTGSASEFVKSSEAVDSRPLPNKGFVPYKRCLAEREKKSSVESSERDRQRSRVYL
jgi:SHAQKYF class myb-like DNA-binding protein